MFNADFYYPSATMNDLKLKLVANVIYIVSCLIAFILSVWVYYNKS